MTNEDKIEAIYKEIANKELSFGCEYKWSDKLYPRTDRVLHYSQEGCGCDEREIAKGKMILAGSAFTDWKCKGCKKTFSYANTRTPTLCLKCAIKKEKCPRCLKYFKIIGHPVMIGDILDYAEHKYSTEDKDPFDEVYKNMQTELKEFKHYLDALYLEKRKPIEEQSEQCIDYIYNLLNIGKH